jgi:peptide/nickel transport system permease protein
LVAGIAATLLWGLIGVSLGVLCGYHRGLLDEIVMRVADIQLSIPYVLFGIALLVMVGPSIPSLIAILALHSWVVHACIVRSQALSLRGREFVEACRALGAPEKLGVTCA